MFEFGGSGKHISSYRTH